MKKLDLKRALSEHNMTQVELARKTGVNAPNISAIVKDGNPTIARLTKIAEAIGCDITDLFYPDPADEAAEKARAEAEEVEESVTKFKKERARANGPLGRTLGEYLGAIDLDKITEDYYARIEAIKEKIYEAFPSFKKEDIDNIIEKFKKLDVEIGGTLALKHTATQRTTLGAPNWNVLTDKNHRLDYSNGALDPVFAGLSGGGELLEKHLKDLEAEKENGQENAQQESTQQENIQPESTQTAIQTSTFCPHCGKKVRVGVVLLPEE